MGHVCIAAMLADLRHLARSLRRSPASAGAAILTLSLTLGAELLMMDAQLEPHFAGALGDGVKVQRTQ